MTSVAKSTIRTQFFDVIFGENEGYVCIATSDPRAPRSRFEQKFFEWPRSSLAMENYILRMEKTHNVYYCVNLLKKQERKKENCLPTDVIWADLDEVDPLNITPPPQIWVESSPGRFQALWLLSTKLEPYQAEQYAKRIAYASGADKSGWDLTQLLRVPMTRNRKYDLAPEISVHIVGTETRAVPLLFEMLPALPDGEGDEIISDKPMPNLDDLPELESVIYKHSHKLSDAFTSLFSYEPAESEDWSKSLWRLLHVCFEAGMSSEEVFVIALNAKCNKYKRDGRPNIHLWRDIVKAENGYSHITVVTANFRPISWPKIIDEDAPIHDDLLIDRYRTWAKEATDAVPEFHDLSSTILLSTIIANSVRLSTSYGPMVPNLWGMILGDSTLSRKTTAMRMVTDLIATLDNELVLATDGTAEGLLSGLETRPNKTSIFYKDELSGFFDSINRREYLAGMPETLTALYDVPAIYTRRLRKEVIRIEHPVFIFFGGGVRDKVYETLTEDYVLSGFLPRFLIVSGNTDMDRLRRTGPPTEENSNKRDGILLELADLYENYATEVVQKIGGQSVSIPPRITAEFSSEAWSRYGDIEELLVNSASNCSLPNLALPTFERLSRSILKMSTIIGASRQIPKDQKVKIETIDVDTAAYYINKWGPFSVEAILNAGVGITERLFNKIEKAIYAKPGILRSQLMQHFHLTKREADEVLGTLEDRGTVRKEKQGRGYAYYAA